MKSIKERINHSVIVRQVRQADGTLSTTYCHYGTPTLVESKWGDWGQYEHPPEVDDDYMPPGGSITYYETPEEFKIKDPEPGTDPGKEQHTIPVG